MADPKDPLADILGDEIGAWDDMFDSLHEDNMPSLQEGVPTGMATRAESEEMEIVVEVSDEDTGVFETADTGPKAATCDVESFARMNLSAAAFFDEDPSPVQSREVTVDLDEDFYDGIEIGVKEQSVVAGLPGTERDGNRDLDGAFHDEYDDFKGFLGLETEETESSTEEITGIGSDPQMGENTAVVLNPLLASEEAFVRASEAADTAVLTAPTKPLDEPETVEELMFVEPAPVASGDIAQRLHRAKSPSELLVVAIEETGAEFYDEIDGALEHIQVPDDVVAEVPMPGPTLADLDWSPSLPTAKISWELASLDVSLVDVLADVPTAQSDRTESFVQLLVATEEEISRCHKASRLVELHTTAGDIAECLGDLDQAKFHFEEALTTVTEQNSSSAALQAQRGIRRITARLGHVQNLPALLQVEADCSSPSEGIALRLMQVDLLLAAGELDAAQSVLQKVLAESPGNIRAQTVLLEMAVARDDDGETLSLVQSLQESAVGARFRGASLLLAGTFGEGEQSSSWIQQATALAPGVVTSFANLEFALLEGKRTELAGLLRGASTSCGESEPALSAALLWLEAQEAPADRAEVLVSEGLEVFPNDIPLRALRVQLGPSADNWHNLGTAIRESSNSKDDATWLAQCWSLAGRLCREESAATSVELSQAACDINPENSYYRDSLRRGQRAANMLEAVADSDTEALRDNPTSALLAYRSAQSSNHVDLRKQALQVLDLYLDSSALRIFARHLAHRGTDLPALERYQTLSENSLGQSRTATRFAMQTGLQEHKDRAVDLWSAQATDSLAARQILAALDSGGASCDIETEGVSWQQLGRLLSAGHTERALCGLVALQEHKPSKRGQELLWAHQIRAGHWAAAAAGLAGVLEPPLLSDTDYQNLYRSALLRIHRDVDVSAALEALQRMCTERPEFVATAQLLAAHSEPSASTSVQVGAQLGFVLDETSTDYALRQAEQRIASAGAAGLAEFGALAARSGDPLVQYGYEQACWSLEADTELRELLSLRIEEADTLSEDSQLIAVIALAQMERELCHSVESWHEVSERAPRRADALRILEREYGVGSAAHSPESLDVVLERIMESVPEGQERAAVAFQRAYFATDSEAKKQHYEQTLQSDPQCSIALHYLESVALQDPPSEGLAHWQTRVAEYFSDDVRACAAFLVRAGETWRELADEEAALVSFQSALELVPGFSPALFAWRDIALSHQNWEEFATVSMAAAEHCHRDEAKLRLYLLAGVALVEREDMSQHACAQMAIAAFSQVLQLDPMHGDGFARLSSVLTSLGRYEELLAIVSARLEHETDDGHRCRLHHLSARILREQCQNASEAYVHYKAILAIRPGEVGAIEGVSDVAWELHLWTDAAEALMVRARMDNPPDTLKEIFFRLGTIYRKHVPQVDWALKSFGRVLKVTPGVFGDIECKTLEALGELGIETGDFKVALGAFEQLLQLEPPVSAQIRYLHQVASIFGHLDNVKLAERALRFALEKDTGSSVALDALVTFYLDRDDLRSARIHVDRVVNAMRGRLESDIADTEAYIVLARAMEIRDRAAVPGSMRVAVAAAQMALLLGIPANCSEGALLQRLITQVLPPHRVVHPVIGAEEDLFFPMRVQGSVRELFAVLGEKIARLVGLDFKDFGLAKNEKLAKEHPIAQAANRCGAELGMGHIPVYISREQPRVVTTIAHSIVLGKDLSSMEFPEQMNFFLGSAAKFAQSRIGVPLQLGIDGFGALLVGVLQQFQPEFVAKGVPSAAANEQKQRFRKLVSGNLAHTLAPHALALATADFDHREIWYDLMEVGDRAGLLSAGSLKQALAAMMRQRGIGDFRQALQNRQIAAVVRFACSEDYARFHS